MRPLARQDLLDRRRQPLEQARLPGERPARRPELDQAGEPAKARVSGEREQEGLLPDELPDRVPDLFRRQEEQPVPVEEGAAIRPPGGPDGAARSGVECGRELRRACFREFGRVAVHHGEDDLGQVREGPLIGVAVAAPRGI